jgi:hypothetical protein
MAKQVETARDRIRHLRAAITQAPAAVPLLARTDAAAAALDQLATSLLGDADRTRLHEATSPSIRSLVDRVVWHHRDTTSAPTGTQRATIERAGAALETATSARDEVIAELDAITSELDAAGGVWTPR